MARNKKDKKEILTLKQAEFCKLYTTRGEYFGNGTKCYALAYGYDLENADRTNEKDAQGKEKPYSSKYDKLCRQCASGASENLRKPLIIEKINELLILQLNDTTVDAELTRLLLNARKEDVRLGSIKHYNDLRQRITKKVDVNFSNNPFKDNSDDELRKMLEE